MRLELLHTISNTTISNTG